MKIGLSGLKIRSFVRSVMSIVLTLLIISPIQSTHAATREVPCGTGTYTITDGVASAGTDCTGALVFESDVTEIANQGFREAAITSLTLPPNLTTIRYAAFYGTSQYPTLVIPDSVTLIENQAFEQGQFTSLTIGNGLTAIRDQVFYRNYGVRINSLTFGTGLTSIGVAAFQNLGVTKLTLPSGLTTLSGRAFDAVSAKILILPNSLTSVNSTAFVGGSFDIVKYCGSDSAVTSYAFNVAITCGAIIEFDANQGSGTMAAQTSNSDTTLRANRFSRADYTFNGWNTQADGQGSVISASDPYPFSTSVDRKLFAQWTFTVYDANTGNGNVMCSTSGHFRVSSYVVASNSSCGGAAVIPTGVTSIGANAFFNASNVSSVLIPSSVTSIGAYSFYGTAISSVDIPNGVTSIGNYAFSYTPSLSSVTIPNSVTSIGGGVFAFATALTSISLPNMLTSIPIDAFRNTTLLAQITIPDSVTSIGYRAFQSTTSLSSITLPEGLLSIGNEAFRLSGLTALTIPNSVTSLGSNSFLQTNSLLSYTYCGSTLTDSNLNLAQLQSKTRNSCVAPIPYIEPTPEPYFKSLTAPKINLQSDKLICTPGTYNAGYTLNGQIQGDATTLFTPSTFTYNLLINGIAQPSFAVTSSNPTNSWNHPGATSGSLITCSVTVTVNGMTNIDKSTDNSSAVSSALSAQTEATSAAETAYLVAKSANLKAYQKALIDNRAQWRTEITAIRANYFEVLARINSESSSRKMISDKSTALKTMIAAQKKSAADYSASKPAAIAAKDAADKAALDAKKTEIAKANATYGTFIESIGYGVLIP